MTESEKMEAEKRELNLLIGKGFSFSLDVEKTQVRKRFFGLIRRRHEMIERQTFTIKEPTLFVLDRLSEEFLQMAIDEERMKADNAVDVARNLVVMQSRRTARTVAIAVAGAKQNDDDIAELTDLFFRKLKPSDLYSIAQAITAVSNFGDFTNSIRLMGALRSTRPILIEEKRPA